VLGRDWRMSVHRTADEIEGWMTGRPGIAATRIAYLRGPSIRIVDSDGAVEITVPTEELGYGPAWNSTGSALVYSTFGGNSRVLHMDLATGRSRPLMGPTTNVLYLTPSFSPDGRSVVYARSIGEQSDLYVAPIDRPEASRRLTVARGVLNTNPIFSPDGRRVVYVSSAIGRPELYIVNADGTGADLLTNYDFSDRNYRSDPDWSPDGRLVAYQERINDHFQIRTIPVSGGTPKLLTSEGENEQPSWAPDGRHLVFTSTRTGVRQLWIMDVESGRFRQLTKSAGSKLASWSPRIPATP
jgi:TolB protein